MFNINLIKQIPNLQENREQRIALKDTTRKQSYDPECRTSYSKLAQILLFQWQGEKKKVGAWLQTSLICLTDNLTDQTIIQNNYYHSLSRDNWENVDLVLDDTILIFVGMIIVLWLCRKMSSFLFFSFFSSKLYAQSGAWTHDPKIRRCTLYQLSHPGAPKCPHF